MKYSSLLGHISLVLLAAAVTFSNRTLIIGSIIGKGGYRPIIVRLEDILIIFLGLFIISLFFLSKKKKYKKPPLFPLFIIWISFELASSLVNVILGYLPFQRVPFYTLKLIEYAFIFYYVFYRIKNSSDSVKIMKVWVFFIWIDLVYIIYQLFVLDLRFFEYGPRIVGEVSPFGVSTQFLILFIYSSTFYIFYLLKTLNSRIKRILFGIIYLTSFIGVFTPGSKAAAFTGVVSVFLILFLYMIKSNIARALPYVFVFLFMFSTLFVSLALDTRRLGPEADFLARRTLNPSSYFRSLSFRAIGWGQYLTLTVSNPLHVLVGRGGADAIAEASHNEFVRNFVAGGIVGSVIFLLLIASIIKKSLSSFIKESNPLSVAFSAALFVSTVAMLFMSFSAEPFFIVRAAEHYWYFAGVAFAAIYLGEQKSDKPRDSSAEFKNPAFGDNLSASSAKIYPPNDGRSII